MIDLPPEVEATLPESIQEIRSLRRKIDRKKIGDTMSSSVIQE